MSVRPSRRAIAIVQAAYYVPTAVAPFVSRRGFETVTGPKRDWWLVLTVAALVGVDGVALASAAVRRSVTAEVRFLGVGTAAALAGVDIAYVGRGRIARTYLVDAAIQLALVAGWVLAE
jgi:hypothetical protein